MPHFLLMVLDALLETARIIPAVNQVRLAPGVYLEECLSLYSSQPLPLDKLLVPSVPD